MKRKLSRRNFISYLLGGILGAEALWFLFRSSGRQRISLKDSELYDAGAIDSFERNQIYTYTSGKFNLVRYKDGGFMALSSQCTHLACIVSKNVDRSGFTCPCHASKFDAYGEVQSSPATRPLDVFPIIFKDEHVWVDINRPLKRQKFKKEQLYYKQ